VRLRRAAQRKEPGVVLLEGGRVIEEACRAGVSLELLALREGDRLPVPAQAHAVLSRGLFRQLTQVETPQGALALARAAWRSFDEAREAARQAGWPLVALDGVQDPGNAGAIVRTAAGAGAPAVVALPGTADLWSPKAIRASAGNVFRTTVARAAWADLEGLRAIGAAAAGGRLPAEIDWRAADVLVLGSEAHGLSRELATVTIPLAAGVGSLNVAAAAAVLLFSVREALA
jgi:TrmH family RNA methyltransferase